MNRLGQIAPLCIKRRLQLSTLSFFNLHEMNRLKCPKFTIRRSINTHKHPSHIGFAFDIDGVLLKGSNVLATGHKALQTLSKK
jgi:hypothetical protein